ncbi:RNH-1.0 protein, partial [Aphelenchoides avenae]
EGSSRPTRKPRILSPMETRRRRIQSLLHLLKLRLVPLMPSTCCRSEVLSRCRSLLLPLALARSVRSGTMPSPRAAPLASTAHGPSARSRWTTSHTRNTAPHAGRDRRVHPGLRCCSDHSAGGLHFSVDCCAASHDGSALPPTTVAALPRSTPTAAAVPSSRPQPPTTNRKRTHAPEHPLANKRAKVEIISPPPSISDKPPSKKRVKAEGMSPPPAASDNPSAPVVYTDGACSKNGKSGAKAGYGVFWGDGHPDNVGAPVNGTATN